VLIIIAIVMLVEYSSGYCADGSMTLAAGGRENRHGTATRSLRSGRLG
jgi:hypothetical protein